MQPGDFHGLRVFCLFSKKEASQMSAIMYNFKDAVMAESKLCSFCTSKKTCTKPKAARIPNCKDYIYKTESEN